MTRLPDSSFRFRPHARIKLQRDIDLLHTEGRRFYGAFLTLALRLRADSDGTGALNRFAVRVPKKLGSAVQRNRAKRLLRELFRLNQKNLKPNLELLFTFHKSVPTQQLHLSVVQKEFIVLCQKAAIWKPAPPFLP